MLKSIWSCFFLLIVFSGFAQTTRPSNGPRDSRPERMLYKNATVVVSPDKILNNTDLLVEDGRIKAVGTKLNIPQGTIENDLTGFWIYPAFIDLYSDFGMGGYQPVKSIQTNNRGQKLYSEKPGNYYWNETIHPETEAHLIFESDTESAGNLRNAGFGALLTHVHDGIARGSACLVSTGEEAESRSNILMSKAAIGLSLSKGTSRQSYPSSQMGSIALIRQLYYDGLANDLEAEQNLSLLAWQKDLQLPAVFAASSWLEVLRAGKIAKEFGKSYIIKAGGDEYQRINAIKALNIPLILPLNFPSANAIADAGALRRTSLHQLKHTALAPRNPALLELNKITFTFTAHGLKDVSQFKEKLIQAVLHGLSEKKALQALTIVPAQLIGCEKLLGTLEAGKMASFFISDKNYFDKESKILETVIQGKSYQTESDWPSEISGLYRFSTGDGNRYKVELNSKSKEFTLIWPDTVRHKGKMTYSDDLLNFSITGVAPLVGKYWSGTGIVNDKNLITGNGFDEKGLMVNWTLQIESDSVKSGRPEKKEDKIHIMPDTKILFPFNAYGNEVYPVAQKILFKNATLWTNEKDGILNQTDLLIENGKIIQIGKNLNVQDAQIVDGTGKHITSGIIDEHSHIAISSGVNESGQESSAEVRIGDVVNSEDVNIYRQLSGGVTACQLLHGSANPIGGQSAIIKLRWGVLPEELKVESAPGFIKFALGENVKQSNWNLQPKIRYPQSRMGVEQVFDEYFSRAQTYKTVLANKPGMRRDLELDALVEIIEGKRFITCHSYQQGEINMLMKMAEKYNFRINTFTHILEGYKVADKMKNHGVGASTFSDWWAYKYEVIDAIPYNGKILNDEGLVVAYNSDDAEMARRLNQEAAKAVRYGNVSEEEAWKFVTLNPAKLLHLDHKMGSLKAGKDADIVLWSDHPMSIYAKAEQTYVDGVKYFDRHEDVIKRETIAQEKARLAKAFAEFGGGKGRKGEDAEYRPEVLYHCEDFEEEDAGHSHSKD